MCSIRTSTYAAFPCVQFPRSRQRTCTCILVAYFDLISILYVLALHTDRIPGAGQFARPLQQIRLQWTNQYRRPVGPQQAAALPRTDAELGNLGRGILAEGGRLPIPRADGSAARPNCGGGSEQREYGVGIGGSSTRNVVRAAVGLKLRRQQIWWQRRSQKICEYGYNSAWLMLDVCKDRFPIIIHSRLVLVTLGYA